MRSGQYVTKRILRLTASPHSVAAGVAAGVLTSFTPFLGLHFVTAFFFSVLFRGNYLAAALGTFFGNPLTFPVIWAATYETGHFFLGSSATTEGASSLAGAMAAVLASLWSLDGGAVLSALNEIWTPLLWPMLLGGMFIGPFFAVPAYMITRRAALIFRESRRDKLLAKAALLRDRARALAEKQQAALQELPKT